MASLIARSPCQDLLPLEFGGVNLTEQVPTHITSVMPFDGQEKALSAALKWAHGMAFPAPRRATGGAAARAVWTGRGQAFLIGPEAHPSLARHAALSDQTDAWAVMSLSGNDASDVMARLCPLDTNAAVFKRNHAARTLIGHMAAIILRTGADAFTIMVFRSMAGTAVHELETAMRGVAARRALDARP